MGTRADFYVGRGEDAEWLGSIAWDGYPEGIDQAVLEATKEPRYREAVAHLIRTREDGTEPSMGWPWPWENSATTDYAYAFDEGKVWASCFGDAWHDPDFERWDDEKEEEIEPPGPPATFPDFSEQKHSAPAGSQRSGVMVISVPTQQSEGSKT